MIGSIATRDMAVAEAPADAGFVFRDQAPTGPCLDMTANSPVAQPEDPWRSWKR